jgi:ApbE superfamily uncharacterized protein (UPF0280 family)
MFYREQSNSRFLSKTLNYCHTDVAVGVAGVTIEKSSLWGELYEEILTTYELLEQFIESHQEFGNSYSPLQIATENQVIAKMLSCSAAANVGPMATVAGMFSEQIVEAASRHCQECYCENGGDIALTSREEVEISLFPGWEMEGTDLGIRLPAGRWGIASSSGKFGRSQSLGQADMVTVVADSAICADAFATAIANQIQPDSKPDEILQSYKQLKAVAVFHEGQFYYQGDFELNFG